MWVYFGFRKLVTANIENFMKSIERNPKLCNQKEYTNEETGQEEEEKQEVTYKRSKNDEFICIARSFVNAFFLTNTYKQPELFEFICNLCPPRGICQHEITYKRLEIHPLICKSLLASNRFESKFTYKRRENKVFICKYHFPVARRRQKLRITDIEQIEAWKRPVLYSVRIQ